MLTSGICTIFGLASCTVLTSGMSDDLINILHLLTSGMLDDLTYFLHMLTSRMQDDLFDMLHLVD